eukprot:TRINITY_DN23260_c0_g1_i2.p1 TRINITY_DN23260_c0_g1~~TRINITY_DN23260_c0_g1_i2.p1  ORF type:complete len:448 (+),score=51.30 TRINITY_DN23260_c0_g1_i2:336-1679(+)
MVGLAAHPLTMFLFLSLARVVQQHGLQFEGALFDDLLHRSPFAYLATIVPAAVALYAFGDYITPASLDVLYAITVFRLVWEDAACGDAVQLLSVAGFSTSGRFAGAALFGRPSVSVGLNVVVATVKCGRYITLLASLSPEDQDYVIGIHGPAWELLLYEVGNCTAIGVVCCGIELWNRSSVRSRLQAISATKRVKTLMSMMCNSVVTVDEDLLLMEPSLQLADFLFRRPPNNSYKDTSLLQFLAEEDREYVRKQINPSSTSGGIPLPMSVKLVDGNGCSTGVRMYCIDAAEEGVKGYVIGILDDKAGALEAGLESLIAAAPEDRLGDLRGFAALKSASERDTESDATSVTGSMISSMEVAEACDATAFEVWVDRSHAQMPILEADAALSKIIGPIESGKSNLIDWAPGLLTGLTMAFETYMTHSSEALATVNLGSVRLEPKTAQTDS